MMVRVDKNGNLVYDSVVWNPNYTEKQALAVLDAVVFRELSRYGVQ